MKIVFDEIGTRLENRPSTRIRIFLNPQLFLSGFTVHTLSDSLRIYHFSTLESRFKNIRIQSGFAAEFAWCMWRRIRKEKVADSKISWYVWREPNFYLIALGFPGGRCASTSRLFSIRKARDVAIKTYSLALASASATNKSTIILL